VCSGTSQTYSVTAVSGATSYTWTLPSGWTGTSTTNSITTTVGTTGGTISVTANNGCGSSTARTLVVSVPNPNVNLSVNSNIITVAESGASYQWLDCNNGNNPISGETSQSYEFTQSGSYAVEVTLNGCSETSNCENVTYLNINQEDVQNAFSIYPNPTNGVFTINSNMQIQKIEILNTLGQVVLVKEGNNQQRVDVSIDDTPGVYFIKLTSINNTNNNPPTIKLIKQ
jgi:hypothetical protein